MCQITYLWNWPQKMKYLWEKMIFFLIPTGTLAAGSARALSVGLAMTVYKILVKMAAVNMAADS